MPAPPSIDQGGIVNAASRMPASLPGGAIAPGARVIIQGVRFGASPSVCVGQSQAPIYHATENEIEAQVPITAVPGPTEVTITDEGRTSEPYKLTLVNSSFGFSPQFKQATLSQVITLEGTGAGDVPLQVLIGNKSVSAKVTHEPAAVDKLTFQIPADAPQGCSVPIQAVTPDGRASNTISIGIHQPGRPCIDQVDWFRAGAAAARNTGFLALAHVAFAANHDFDFAFASFGHEEAGHRPLPPLPPVRTCTLIAGSINVRQVVTRARNQGPVSAIPKARQAGAGLDIGPAISIHGPNGDKSVPRDPGERKYYDALLGGFPTFTRKPPTPLFLTPGAYQIRSAKLSAALRVPPPIRWTNRDDITEVNRNDGVTLEWQAAQPDDVILIAAASADSFTGDAAACLCVASAAERRFTVPAVSLANLPATAEGDKDLSYLLMAELPARPRARIHARAVRDARAAYLSISIHPVTYK